MDGYSITNAKAYLSELINRLENGETVEITRHGKPVAQLTPPERLLKKVDVDALRRLTAGMPMQKQSAGEFIREMRDADRY